MKEFKNLFDPKEYQVKRGQVPRYEIQNAILLFDIVGFSADMVNEKMMEIVVDIHTSMWDVLDTSYFWAEKGDNSNKNDLLLIPTGDGYGLAINNLHKDEEILEIAAKLYRRFIKEELKFRMGIAKARNVLTIDLNDNLNIFGYGIVLAARVCNEQSCR